jgi:hypothetical protein
MKDNNVQANHEFTEVNSTRKIHTIGECFRSGRFPEPCEIAPAANPRKPQPPKDWEMPDNRELLWEQELHRTNGGDSRSVAWLTLYYGCDGERDAHDDDAPCRFVVAFNDVITYHGDNAKDGRWHHDITASLLGQDILKAWIALNPKEHAALPKNYGEWYERGRRAAFEDTCADVKKSGIDVTGMSEDEVYQCWNDIRRQCLLARLKDQGYSPKEIAEQMREKFGEYQ